LKVAKHAKAQTARSKDALYAHAAMTKTLISAQTMAPAKLELARIGAPRRPANRWFTLNYILRPDHSIEPVQTDNPDGTINRDAFLRWGQWFENHENRQVAHTKFADGSFLSTVFLGIDHGHGRTDRPVLFESMIFSAAKRFNEITAREYPEEVDMRRYCTWDEAVAGHQQMQMEHAIRVAKIMNLTKGQGE
jgi:hypothetical protein